jgi:hypothetical protein
MNYNCEVAEFSASAVHRGLRSFGTTGARRKRAAPQGFGPINGLRGPEARPHKRAAPTRSYVRRQGRHKT